MDHDTPFIPRDREREIGSTYKWKNEKAVITPIDGKSGTLSGPQLGTGIMYE